MHEYKMLIIPYKIWIFNNLNNLFSTWTTILVVISVKYVYRLNLLSKV